ncbi:MAG: tetratricopeptide repeat protein [Pseudomonadota bacterium]
MTDDPFREVDEDLRESRRTALLKQYAPYAVAIVLAVVAVAGGREIWMSLQSSRATADAEQYLEAAELADADPAAAAARFAALGESAGRGYAALALMREAAARSESGDQVGAVAAYERLIARGDAPELLVSVARLQAARLMLEQATREDVEARLGDLADERSQFRGLALEIRGLAAYRAGDPAAAREAFDAIIMDPLAGEPVRARADAMLGLLGPLKTPSAASDPEGNVDDQ